MELTNDFNVAVPVEEAWTVLTDLERIAPCMPGAQLQEVEGDEYRGIVKVKVGPITAQYKGAATFQDKDDVAHRAVLRAEGRETRGQGTASATITATLTPNGEGTAVSLVTDLAITGKVAQIGRGVLADVSAKLLDQFVASLEHDVLGGPTVDDEPPAKVDDPEPVMAQAPPTAAVPAPEAPREVRTIASPEPAPVDLVGTAGAPIAKRVAPVAAAFAVLWLVRLFLKRRKA